MDNNKLSIGDAGSLLIGAGLTKLDTIGIALILIGVGVFLKIIIALLQKQGIPVEKAG